MCDERIFYLLSNYNNSAQDDYNGSFIKLQPKIVKNVGKNLASLIWDSDKSQNRSGYIELLRKFCGSRENHITVNQTNYKTFLEVLPISQEEVDVDAHKLSQDLQDDNSLSVVSVQEEILKFYGDRALVFEKKQKHLNSINEYNLRSFKELDYTPSKTLQNFLENQQMVLGLLQDKETETSQNSQYLLKEHRESNVKLGYAVIHLDAPDKLKIVKNILTHLQCNSSLKKCELDFIKFVFNNVESLQLHLLKQFPSLIEIPLIELCTEILNNPSINLDERLTFINKCAKVDGTTKNTVINICYEMYALSGYNEAIMDLIKYFQRLKI